MTEKEDKEVDSGKNKEGAAVTTLAVQQGSLATGSSRKAGGSSSGQGQRQHHILMNSTLMLNPDTISKRFTQEIEIRVRTAVNEALRRYIYNIKKFKCRWRKSLPTDKHADRRTHSPPRPRRESKFTPDYKKMVIFIPESGQVQVLQEQRQYKYSWAEMADKILAVQDDF